jgi:hypothetical protein
VARRAPSIGTIHVQIDQAFASGNELGLVLVAVCRLSVRLMMHIDAEVPVGSRGRTGNGGTGRSFSTGLAKPLATWRVGSLDYRGTTVLPAMTAGPND